MAAHERDRERDLDLEEILAALAMPRGAVRGWLDDVAGFCARHGGARRYATLLALVDACRRTLDEDRR